MRDNSLFFESFHPVKGLAPAADRWNTNPATDVVSLANFENVCFLVHQTGGTTGKATLTVNASALNTGASPTAIPFKYRVGSDGAGAASDAFGAITDATAAGFDTTPAIDAIYLIEVNASQLPVDKKFVHLLCTESVNDPVVGAVEILLYNPRYGGATQPTAIS